MTVPTPSSTEWLHRRRGKSETQPLIAQAAEKKSQSGDTGLNTYLKYVPRVAVEVVVPSEEDPARLGERDRGDAAHDRVVRVLVQLAVCADVEEPARGVVRPSRERLEEGQQQRCVLVKTSHGREQGKSRTPKTRVME